MDKNAIKKFAVKARVRSIEDARYRARLCGITENGIAPAAPGSTKDALFIDIGAAEPVMLTGREAAMRAALADKISERAKGGTYAEAYKAVMEEAAYTWFNRLIAVRFMEVNDYLPSGVRVLSSEDRAKAEPDLVTRPFDSDLEFTEAERQTVQKLKFGETRQLDELFRMLFIKQCNKLNEILPGLFEKTDDWTELLLNISYSDPEGLVRSLTSEISEDDFNVEKEGQVEIIGWLYQFYNTEPKDEAFALLKKNVKVTKERIPAVTQLFTPDWIVRYMVENSAGRIWTEHLRAVGQAADDAQTVAGFGWKYYLPEAPQEPEVEKELTAMREQRRDLHPEEIKIIDPCMGSGHILVYAFELLMQIYQSCGYAPKDAAVSIIKNNLYGLDIDDRAYQLAYFAVMMKARQYDRFLFRHRPRTNLWSIQESNFITEELIKYAAHGDEKLEDAIRSIKADLSDAKEYGSILDVKPVDFGALIKSIEETSEAEKIGIGLGTDALEELLPLVKQAKVMAQKYDAVITNPPYMGSSNMDAALSEYVKKNYPDTKSDMSTVFMEKCLRFCSKDGFIAMLNIPVWMFLSSYEKLRKSLIEKDLFINMLHLGRGVFGSDFGTTSFVIENTSVQKYIGNYKRLFPRQGAVDTIEQKEMWFLDGFGNYIADQGDFTGIPGAPVAYWVSSKLLSIIRENRNLDSYASPRQGLITGDNNRFLRLWFEVSAIKTGFYSNKNYKWMPINKGGEFRRWYGNQEHVINWENEGAEILNYKDEYGKLRSRPQNLSYNFQESLSWSLVTSGGFSVRYYPNSFMFNVAGIACFPQKFLLYILGLLNTKITSCITQILNPTINMNAGDVAKVPVVISCPHELIICKYVSEAIDISKSDWDSFETSWDFQTHPFLAFKTDGFAEHAFDAWQTHAAEQFAQLKANEEELNRIFIDIYGLQDELSPEEEDKDVTVRRADLARDVRSFVSYGVGCILGRYSLATPGLAYAGGAWNASKYSTFMPDADNCVPITDEEYFSDDIVTRFAAFVSAAFGAETLEANLDFIARALGSKGATPRAALRNYFLNDFFKDHCKIYQKRPIYWLFDSGKENSFKALFYLHRYNADTVGNMRVEYLHPLQEKYERRLEMEKQAAEKSPSARDKAIAKAAAEKLTRQIKEIKAYDQKISHLAAARISLDLDDGVKANYEKLQTAKDAQNLEILAKIK